MLSSWRITAQEITVRGGFIEDSILIGKDVGYWMTATYPPNLEMIFPDSLFDFSPFEYTSKIYFDSKLLANGLIYDSTVYFIQSYEIDFVQYLYLPAVILNKSDSTLIDTPIDSIYLTELAPIVTDTTKLKTNLDYQIVSTQFNYPLLYYVLGGSLFLIILLAFLFGKKIVRWYRLFKLRKGYEKFNQFFSEHIKKLKIDPNPQLTERTLILWKKYQDTLESIPFSVLTTQEILKKNFTKKLEKPLKSIDRVIYSNRIQEDIYQEFHQIEDFTQYRYSEKIEKIKHGK